MNRGRLARRGETPVAMSKTKTVASAKRKTGKAAVFERRARKHARRLAGSARPERDEDALARFLSAMDDKDDWRRVRDADTDRERLLSPEELEAIARVRAGLVALPGHDAYPRFEDSFSADVLPTPLRCLDEPKRRFVPSHWEAVRVSRLVRAIRAGLVRVGADGRAVRNARPKEEGDLWGDDGSADLDASSAAFSARRISAPRMALPRDDESYNPPAGAVVEPGSAAHDAWLQAQAAAREAGRPWLADPPRIYAALRAVPAYARLVAERSARCLDLLLCPRAMRRAPGAAADLLPVLPDPRDLRPFPTTLSVRFDGAGAVCALAVDPSGQWLLSASSDGSVRLWDASTGRLLSCWPGLFPAGAPVSLAWNPNRALVLFALSTPDSLLLVVPSALAGAAETRAALDATYASRASSSGDSACAWRLSKSGDSADQSDLFARVALASAPSTASGARPTALAEVAWHRRGDYCATLGGTRASPDVCLHQLSRRASRRPLARVPGAVHGVAFHPARPHLVLLCERAVRVFDLARGVSVLRLRRGAPGPGILAAVPGGDHFLVAGPGRDVSWLDADRATRGPVRTVAVQRTASHGVRALAVHSLLSPEGAQAFPLFAAGGDDGSVAVVHGRAPADLASEPTVVPVAAIRVGAPVHALAFHPAQPWLFVGAADGHLALYV